MQEKERKTERKLNTREKTKQICFNKTQEQLPVYSAHIAAMMSSRNWDMAHCV